MNSFIITDRSKAIIENFDSVQRIIQFTELVDELQNVGFERAPKMWGFVCNELEKAIEDFDETIKEIKHE